MNSNRFLGVSIVCAALILAATNLLATPIGDPNTSLSYGYSLQGTEVASEDALSNTGVYDAASNNWVRLEANPGGALVTTNCTTRVSGQQSVNASAVVPAAAVTGRTFIDVFNQSTSVILYCGTTSPATTANANMIEPRTGRRFDGSTALYCISASGAITVDYADCGS